MFEIVGGKILQVDQVKVKTEISTCLRHPVRESYNQGVLDLAHNVMLIRSGERPRVKCRL